MRTEIVRACEKELAPALKRFPSTQNSVTESLRNGSEADDATTAGYLLGCHETLPAHTGLLQ